MLSVDEALQRVLSAVSPLPLETVPLCDALGRVTATDIVASVDLPAFRNSAMDGYAVLSSDTVGASPERPVILKVTGEIAAGEAPAMALKHSQAARVMTGAPVPHGADAVVRFEDTDEELRAGSPLDVPAEIGILRPASPHANVREAGEDVETGDLAIPAGAQIRSAEIGLLAALNEDTVDVHCRPSVAILSTGNEIVSIGEPLGPGQIRDTNGAMLAALAAEAGAEPVSLGIARDDVADLTDKLQQCASWDYIVTSGGVSAGAYDMVKDVLQAEGSIDLWQVRMKPGKPLAFGQVGSTPLLGLPGNPVAAAVAFAQFGAPAIRRMLGMQDVLPETVPARLLEAIENPGNRRHYVRALLERNGRDGYTVRAVGPQGAGMLTSLTRANALIVIPEEIEHAGAGAMVQVQILR
jgi:molybdopterin molybdotransferase